MFTQKRYPLLAVVLVGCGGLLTTGCGAQPDPQKYGETITEVPPDLDKPFPLPQLDKSVEDGDEVSK